MCKSEIFQCLNSLLRQYSIRKAKALQVLQRSSIRLVLVGLSIVIELQKRQCTVRSHELITDNYYNT